MQCATSNHPIRQIWRMRHTLATPDFRKTGLKIVYNNPNLKFYSISVSADKNYLSILVMRACSVGLLSCWLSRCLMPRFLNCVSRRLVRLFNFPRASHKHKLTADLFYELIRIKLIQCSIYNFTKMSCCSRS